MPNLHPDDLKRAQEETRNIQKNQLATKKRDEELHIKNLTEKLRKLGDEIHDSERDHTALVAQQEAIGQEEKKAKEKLRQVFGTTVRGKTESQGIVAKIKTFKTQLAELTKKKAEFTATLAELGQKAASKTPTGSQKDEQEKLELERLLSVLEKEMETLTISIRADEARLNEEKATLLQEKTQLEQTKQKLTKITTVTQKGARNKDTLQIEEKKREADTKKTETLLHSIEGEIQKVAGELETTTRQAKMQEATLQKSSTEEDVAKKTIATAQGKLLPGSHSMKTKERELVDKKAEEAKARAELRKAEEELHATEAELRKVA
ncbi:MAG: hypothetical protein NUW02_02125 [Candidatus Campbellbacteria bacterium]|nr:hypothetical protein [Candidatus Campbellbacteria bacterium]